MAPSRRACSLAAPTGLLIVLLSGCNHPGRSDDAMTAAVAPCPGLAEPAPGLDATGPAVPLAVPLAVPPAEAPDRSPRAVWGIVDFRGFPLGEQIASNGVEYHQIFVLDLNFNIMLWPQQHVYLFSDAWFWGQKAAPGITNPTQGAFDYSKREFDFNVGAAWNYAGAWEARAFAYSFNNLNRGTSMVAPVGFNDGVGLENRYYLGRTYADLGTAAFDAARATFLSIGYYPSKSMVDANGNAFRPGPFARAYLTWDVWGEQYYLFGDIQFVAARSMQPTLLNFDAGLAARPFTCVPRLEFRAGALGMLNLQGGDLESSAYLGVRYIY
jgi:hypothetical protein